jgi:predicted kinase
MRRLQRAGMSRKMPAREQAYSVTLMTMKRLIVITGHSASGKTTLARELAATYKILCISKDAIKERIFDGVGYKDKQWSLALSGVSHRIMDDIIEQELYGGHQLIIESNFKHDRDSERFTQVIKKHDAGCLQILCKADPEVLFKRWNDRIENGARHPGQVEEITLEEIRQGFLAPYQALDLPGEFVEIDTTDVTAIQLPKLA